MNNNLKEEIMRKAAYLISKTGQLNIIYMRVSTNEQSEGDQEKDIFNAFELEKRECLIIKAKESAFKKKKQKYRKLNIIYEILEQHKEPRKRIYFWDLDRIYRRRTLLVDFFSFCKSHNAIILSYRQKFLYELRNLPNELGDVISSIMIQLLGWIAEEESLKRADRLKKSITRDEKNDRWITNKGKVHGCKIKRILKNGKRKSINDPELLKKIDDGVVRSIKKRIPYRRIIEILKQKKIRVSLGYISSVKQRRGLLPRIKKPVIEKKEKIVKQRTPEQERQHQKYLKNKKRMQEEKLLAHQKEQLKKYRLDNKKRRAENRKYGFLPE